MKKTLFYPFENYTEKQLLSFGFLFTILGSLLAYMLNARFDGALDLHFVKELSFAAPFLDNLINLLSITFLLFSAGKIINTKTRLLDMFIAALIFRLPIYLLSLTNINSYLYSITEKFAEIDLQNPQVLPISELDMSIILVFALVTITFIVYALFLLYQGYKVACNAKGAKPIVFFIIAVLMAEILSKLFIYQLNY